MDAQQFREELANTYAHTGVVFPDTEYEDRLARVRKKMRAEGLDGLLVTDHCNLFYLTGYYTFGSGNHACLVIPLKGELTLQICSLEIPAAVINTRVKDLAISNWQLQYSGQFDAGKQLAQIVCDKGMEKKRLGVETARRGLLASVYQSLHDHLQNATLVDASTLVDELTYVKSPLELECMRQAGKYTVAGIKGSCAAARPGVMDNDIARAGYDAMIAAGSEFMSVQPIVTSGPRSSFLHQTYRRVEIEENDIVFLEYGGCHHRYTAPLMRTVVIGQPTDHMLRIADAVETTLATIIEALKPGRTFHDVVMDARKPLAKVESEVHFFGSYGYGIGIGFPPTWGGSLHMTEGSQRVLETGMTFHLPICLPVPGKFNVAISESVVISRDGCELLCDHPRQLFYA